MWRGQRKLGLGADVLLRGVPALRALDDKVSHHREVEVLEKSIGIFVPIRCLGECRNFQDKPLLEGHGVKGGGYV